MRRTASFSTFVLAAALPLAATAQVPLGPEFQVNTYTTNYQQWPDVAVNENGDFLVVWAGGCTSCLVGQDGSRAGVYGQRFTASGVPVGPEFQVNSYTTHNQNHPTAAPLPGGGFVVTWDSAIQDGNASGVYARMYDAAGNPGDEFRVNAVTTGSQGDPDVATDASGNFVVVWWSYFGIGNPQTGAWLRRFDATGTPLSDDVFLGGLNPRVAMAPAGQFVVVNEGGSSDIIGRRFTASGAPEGGAFTVNTYTTGGQTNPAVAMADDGGFAVVWGQGKSTFGRDFDGSGVPRGDPFQVNSYTAGDHTFAEIAYDEAGRLVAAWWAYADPPEPSDIRVQAFGPAGVRLGPEFVVNDHSTQQARRPSIAGHGDGSFVVVWSQDDASVLGVRARLLGSDLIFADGLESGSLGAWSSTSDDGGDLIVSGAAALDGTLQGMQGTVDDTAGLFVQDDTPAAERRYRARFWLDPNGFDPGEAQRHFRTRVFVAFQDAPTRRLMALVLKRQDGQYSLMGRARRDDGSQVDTGFFPIDDEPHAVELSWSPASEPGANDGTFELWIDGTSVSALSGIDNDTAAVDFVRLGALSVKGGASGTLFWDEFESRRLSYIGP